MQLDCAPGGVAPVSKPPRRYLGYDHRRPAPAETVKQREGQIK
jgi:hypothetical protein